MADHPLFLGIEAGGTKFICLVGYGPDQMLAEVKIPTTTPDETLASVSGFIATQIANGLSFDAVGIASFGPIDVRPASPSYGIMAATPKPGWQNADMIAPVRDLRVPLLLSTDVSGAVLAEHVWGGGRHASSLAYVTVGTGIGVGILNRGELSHGDWHFEIGHVRPPRDLARDPFPGTCPFHGDCFEGLASGTAIKARWGKSLDQLPMDHPGHALEAEYLGELCSVITFAHAPERIFLGGGVMQTSGLIDRARECTRLALGGYANGNAGQTELSDYVSEPGLGAKAGAYGALALAHKAYHSKMKTRKSAD